MMLVRRAYDKDTMIEYFSCSHEIRCPEKRHLPLHENINVLGVDQESETDVAEVT